MPRQLDRRTLATILGATSVEAIPAPDLVSLFRGRTTGIVDVVELSAREL